MHIDDKEIPSTHSGSVDSQLERKLSGWQQRDFGKHFAANARLFFYVLSDYQGKNMG